MIQYRGCSGYFLRDLVRFKLAEHQQKYSELVLVYPQNIFMYKHDFLAAD